MKHRPTRRDHSTPIVAPFTGARIETLSDAQRTALKAVAPFTGARIETLTKKLIALASVGVAPFTGARIETRQRMGRVESFTSLPSRERGLKQQYRAVIAAFAAVAPITGARIETTPIAKPTPSA